MALGGLSQQNHKGQQYTETRNPYPTIHHTSNPLSARYIIRINNQHTDNVLDSHSHQAQYAQNHGNSQG